MIFQSVTPKTRINSRFSVDVTSVTDKIDVQTVK